MLRIGNSIDIHNLTKENNCQQKLGGVLFEADYKIVAHSDGDVILHAVSESILGALCLGDLGEHFSDKDPNNKNLDSIKILEYALNKMNELNYEIVNIDLSVVTDLIMLADKKEKIKIFLQKYLGTKNINLKATRFEDKKILKIACFSNVLLSKKN